MISKTILNENLNAVISYQEYFSAFGYGMKDTIFLRRFNDKVKNSYGHNYEVTLNNFEAILPELKRQNSLDNGIFYIVNGGGHKDENVKDCRAQFIDIDDYSLEEQVDKLNSFILEPSIIVMTSRSLHPYWLINNGDIKLFRNIQSRLIQFFDSDETIKNESRVMRLYGFEHRKEDPVIVKLIKFNPELRYSQQDFINLLPAVAVQHTSEPIKKNDKLVPVGQRHYYVVRKIGEFVSRLGRSAADEAILALVEADFLRSCEDVASVNMDVFRSKYLRAIQTCRGRFEAEKNDPGFYKYALKAWKAENPGKEFDTDKTSWDEVAEAGRRAKEAGKRFNYVAPAKNENYLVQGEFSDVAQARLFVSEYNTIVRFSKATGFLKYSGKVWEESELKAQRLAQELTDKQLKAVRQMLHKARKMKDHEAESSTPNMGTAAQADAIIEEAEEIRKQIVKRRTSQRISATLTEAAPWLEIDVKELDADGFLLNTPGGTVDLRTGEIKGNDPFDYCTKITTVAPGADGADVFAVFMDQITCGDADLKRYLQEVAGVFAVGFVKREELYIATGSGGNGKSTFFNLLFKAMGDYSGMISSDVLTKNSRANKANELAELRGKRLILASELDEGAALDSAMLKKLASRDPIHGERKYRDPFDFFPSHSVVLYTNYLPRVSARDKGTWDRIVVLPFNANFRNTSGEIKDYGSILFKKCGGAVLSWIIEGARRYIANDFFIEPPESVKTAVDQYRAENDLIGEFLRARCRVDKTEKEMAATLYKGYRAYCDDVGEDPKHISEFKKALESVGIQSRKTKAGVIYKGVRLKKWEELKSDNSRLMNEEIS